MMSSILGSTMISGACNDVVQISTSVVVMTQCLKEISMPTPAEGQLLDKIDVTRQQTKDTVNKSINDVDNTIEEASLRARKEEMKISLESKKTLLESKKKALELARNQNSSMAEQLKLKPINALLETGGLDCIELSSNQMTSQSFKSFDDDKVRFTNGSVLLPIDFCENEEENECENDSYMEKSIYASTHKMLNCIIDEHWSDELKAYYRSGGVYSNGPPAFWGNDYNHEAQLPTSSGHFHGQQKNGSVRYMNGHTEGMRSRQVGNNGIAFENENRRSFGISQDIRHSNRLREQEQQRRSQQLPTSNHQSFHEKKPETYFQQQHQPGNSHQSSISSDRQRQHFRGDDLWQKQQHPKWKEKNNNTPAQNFNGTNQRNLEHQPNIQQQPQHRDIKHETQQQSRWHQNSSRNKQHSNWHSNVPNNGRRNTAYKRTALVDSHTRVHNHPETRRGKRPKPDGDDS